MSQSPAVRYLRRHSDRRKALRPQGGCERSLAGSRKVHRVGKPILRTDVPPKCTGRHIYIQDFHVPEMLHGRVIRRAAIGAHLIAVDEASIGAIPDVRIVRVESFLGVVARNEWAAIEQRAN